MQKYILKVVFLLISVISVTACDPENVLSNTGNSTIKGAESADDYVWDDTNEVEISLNGSSAICSSENVTIKSGTITITKAGNYVISGTLNNGQLLVDVTDGIVRIKLNDVNISNTDSAPFYGKSAEKIVVFLADGTSNSLTDASTYSHTGEPNACMFSNSYLSFSGFGSLTVKGNYNDAISGDDGVVINSGTFAITAKDDGIRGKDYLIVKNGTITVNTTTGHCLKSDNSTEIGYGVVSTEGGTFTLTSAQKDGVHGAKRVVINDGNFAINAVSSQGLKADSLVRINGGSVNVINSTEGIESFNIAIAGGLTILNATNDGINATAGTVNGGAEYNDNSSINVSAGILIANASKGDAIDSNGNMYISGGTVIANGPQSGIEEGADVNGTFQMTGGLLMCAGSNSNMSKSLSTSSTQANMFIKSSSSITSSTLFHIENEAGDDIVTFKPKNGGYYFLFSSSGLSKGGIYKIYTGGTYTGGSFVGETSGYGVYTGGSYSVSGATLKKSATLSTSSTVNTITF